MNSTQRAITGPVRSWLRKMSTMMWKMRTIQRMKRTT